MNTQPDPKNILEIDRLSVVAQIQGEQVNILDSISFNIEHGKVQSLIGPSGSGKTMIALAVLGLLPANIKQISGNIIFDGDSVGKDLECEFNDLRGKKITMIFQEPQASLNPVFKIGTQLNDVIQINQNISKKEARLEAIKILEEVGLADAKAIYGQYPHQLSGGMAQRVLIALALSCHPKLLIADEPTTALDATTQIEILKLLKKLQAKHHFAMLLISHDMQVVKAMADSIIKIDSGKIVSHSYDG